MSLLLPEAFLHLSFRVPTTLPVRVPQPVRRFQRTALRGASTTITLKRRQHYPVSPGKMPLFPSLPTGNSESERLDPYLLKQCLVGSGEIHIHPVRKRQKSCLPRYRPPVRIFRSTPDAPPLIPQCCGCECVLLILRAILLPKHLILCTYHPGAPDRRLFLTPPVQVKGGSFRSFSPAGVIFLRPIQTSYASLCIFRSHSPAISFDLDLRARSPFRSIQVRK
jgi:hypothetical protein